LESLALALSPAHRRRSAAERLDEGGPRRRVSGWMPACRRRTGGRRAARSAAWWRSGDHGERW